MIIDIAHPQPVNIPRLRQIWREAFGDAEDFLDSFFSVGFCPERCLCAFFGEEPVAAIYWFDAAVRGKKVAYLYALATDEDYRGRGIARQLLDATHDLLRQRDYHAALLVPGTRQLGSWYQRLGYEYCCSNANFPCRAADTPVPLRAVTSAEYGLLRKRYLPEGSVEQDDATLAFLATQAQLYAGENFLMAAWRNYFDLLIALEFLGDISAIPGILRALEAPVARIFTPISAAREYYGGSVPPYVDTDMLLPMFHPLQDPALAPPAYFAFPFN